MPEPVETEDCKDQYQDVEPLAIDEMDEQTFNTMMEKGYQQALNGETRPIKEAFAEIRERL